MAENTAKAKKEKEPMIAIRITADEKAELEKMMSESNEKNTSRFIRSKLFAPAAPPTDNAALIEQLNIRIGEKDAAIARVQREYDSLAELYRNQQLLQAQAQALLVDKSLPWYKRLFGRKASTVDAPTE
jgi:hypothetical protein